MDSGTTVIVSNPTPEEVSGRLRSIEDRQVRMEASQLSMQKSIDGNTGVTNEVRDMMDTFKGGMKFLGWGAAIVKWCGMVATGALAVWALVYALAHGVPSPDAVTRVFTAPK